MTELSPAAQAILDAAVGGAHPAFAPIVRPMAAIVLRTAASQLSIRWSSDECIETLQAIANELEPNETP
jgi:hypothetical protein